MSLPPHFESVMRISGASVAGSLHLRDDRPCEDAWEGRVFEGAGVAVVAVSDGLGSARYGGDGASVAVSAAISALSSGLIQVLDEGGGSADQIAPSVLVQAACRAAREAVFSHASASGGTPDEYACTLIVLLWNRGAVTSARIGDGAVVCLQGEKHILLSAPEERRYVNEVVPLTADDYEGACIISPVVTGIRACAVFTDGCERLFLEKDVDGFRPYEPFFRPFFPAVASMAGTAYGDRAIADLLASDTFISFSEDDKTLVVVVSDERRDENT